MISCNNFFRKTNKKHHKNNYNRLFDHILTYTGKLRVQVLIMVLPSDQADFSHHDKCTERVLRLIFYGCGLSQNRARIRFEK
jgi:hypothetical protein